MERPQPNQESNSNTESSKMHSKLLRVYQQLSEEYKAIFERGDPVNPANEQHLKMLEDYLDQRGIPHNNFFIHEENNEEMHEEEVFNFVEDFGLTRKDELSQLIKKQDDLITDLENNPGNIDPRIIKNQIEKAKRLRSKYVIQYRSQKKI